TRPKSEPLPGPAAERPALGVDWAAHLDRGSAPRPDRPGHVEDGAVERVAALVARQLGSPAAPLQSALRDPPDPGRHEEAAPADHGQRGARLWPIDEPLPSAGPRP